MPVPPVNQATRPTRIGFEYTRGKGIHQPELSPIAAAPAPAQRIPNMPTMVGMDIQTTQFAVNVTTGGTQILNAKIPLPALPKLSPGTNDQLVAHISVETSHNASGLTIATASAVVIALPANGSQVSGPVFTGGTSYQNWGALYQGQATSVSGSISANVIVTVQVQLWLYSPKSIFGNNVVTTGGSPVGGGSGGSGTSQGGDHGGIAPPGGGGGHLPL